MTPTGYTGIFENQDRNLFRCSKIHQTRVGGGLAVNLTTISLNWSSTKTFWDIASWGWGPKMTSSWAWVWYSSCPTTIHDPAVIQRTIWPCPVPDPLLTAWASYFSLPLPAWYNTVEKTLRPVRENSSAICCYSPVISRLSRFPFQVT